jgi:hypothetical protein
MPIWRRLFEQAVVRAADLTRETPDSTMLLSTAMIETTTSSSMSENAARAGFTAAAYGLDLGTAMPEGCAICTPVTRGQVDGSRWVRW